MVNSLRHGVYTVLYLIDRQLLETPWLHCCVYKAPYHYCTERQVFTTGLADIRWVQYMVLKWSQNSALNWLFSSYMARCERLSQVALGNLVLYSGSLSRDVICEKSFILFLYIFSFRLSFGMESLWNIYYLMESTVLVIMCLKY